MLTGLRLSNFKAFEELDITLKPITLFLGPNNSGKSSILASIRLLTQTLESNDPGIPLLLDGMMGDFGTYKDLVYRNLSELPIKIGVEVKPTDIFLDWMGVYLGIDLTYKYRSKQREIILSNTNIKLNRASKLSTTILGEENYKQYIQSFEGDETPSDLKLLLASTLRVENFLPLPNYYLRSREEESLREYFGEHTDYILDGFEEIRQIVSAIYRTLASIEYIGAMRLPPARTYLFAGEKRKRVGASGENAVNILAMEPANSDIDSHGVSSKVVDWLRKAGIASNLNVAAISDRHYEIRIQHPVTGEYQNLVDIGQGNSQVLPVLVGGFNLIQGATYIVEEPEIHLHPRAQAELGSFFLTLYEQGVQSLIETHSEHLVVRLQQYVAAGKIPPDDIIVYYVYAKEEKKEVKPLRMDEFGRFIGEWPEGFFPEGLQEAEELSRIRFQAKRRAQNGISH